MEIKHKLSAEQAGHFAGIITKADAFEREALVLRGKAALMVEQAQEYERDARAWREHLGLTVNLIAQAEHLPASKVPYALSQDQASLIGASEEK